MPDSPVSQSGASLTYEWFHDEMRRYVRPDVPDEAICEMWELARAAGRRAAESVGAEPERTPRGQSGARP